MIFSPSKLWFNFLNSNFLIYNICWEDVEVDWKLLQLDENSEVLMITSAGCNALTYLLDDPKSVVSVDINPKQTALLELKTAVIKHGDYSLFEELFAKGKSSRIKELYPAFSFNLSEESRKFWDDNLRFFDPNGRGLFFQGGAGLFARFLNFMIDQKGVRNQVLQLFAESDQDVKIKIFEEVEESLWNGLEKNVWLQGGVLGLAGIPVSQREAVGDLNEFMKQTLFNVFINQDAALNPYWGAYILGSISETAYPEYLKKDHFEILQDNLDRLEVETTSYLEYLKETDRNFTHFVLLDHMDWMVEGDLESLSEQWKHILEKAAPNATILFRTAYPNLKFIPDFVFDKVEFVKIDPDWIAVEDRVGTYTGTYLGNVL